MVERMEGQIDNEVLGRLNETPELTVARAISNIKEIKHSDPSLDSYLDGLEENFRGVLGWMQKERIPTKVTQAFVAETLVFQLATACSPRTVSAEDIVASTTAITEQYTPPKNDEMQIPIIKTVSEATKTPTSEPTPSATPEPTATTEPTESPTPMKIDIDGNYIPVSEAFVDTGKGKIKEIKDLDKPSEAINKVVDQVKEKLSIKNDTDLQKAYLDIVCENGNRAYMLVKDGNTGAFYAVFIKDENGFYLPPDSEGELALLPLKTISKEVQVDDGSIDQQELLGFDVKGDLLIPPTFTYSKKTGELTYIDPKTGEKIILKIDTNTAPKMLAMLKGENTVEKLLTPEQQKIVEDARKYFKDTYHTDPDTIDITFDEHGKEIDIDNISGRVIAIDVKWATFDPNNTTGKDQLENGSWVFNPSFTKKLADEGLEKTDLKPSVRWGINRPGTGVDKYGLKIFEKFKSDNPGLIEQLVSSNFSWRDIFLCAYPDGHYSWGIVIGKKYNNESWSGKSDERYLIYMNSKGEIKYIQIYYPNYLVYG